MQRVTKEGSCSASSLQGQAQVVYSLTLSGFLGLHRMIYSRVLTLSGCQVPHKICSITSLCNWMKERKHNKKFMNWDKDKTTF